MAYKNTSPKRGLTHRVLMGSAAMVLAATLVPGALRAADPLKMPGVYTVAVEQKWVSRLHKAAEAAKSDGQISYELTENVSNTD